MYLVPDDRNLLIMLVLHIYVCMYHQVKLHQVYYVVMCYLYKRTLILDLYTNFTIGVLKHVFDLI